MKVVKALDEEKVEKEQTWKTSLGYIRLKRFHFIMLLFLIVFLSAGITTFALSFGKEKVVTVGTERTEFKKLYEAYDTLKNGYYKNPNQKKLINGAINGMVESLDDPYSDYMSNEEAEAFIAAFHHHLKELGLKFKRRTGISSLFLQLKDLLLKKQV